MVPGGFIYQGHLFVLKGHQRSLPGSKPPGGPLGAGHHRPQMQIGAGGPSGAQWRVGWGIRLGAMEEVERAVNPWRFDAREPT